MVLCRNYPNCSDTKCRFSHPIQLEQKTITQKEETTSQDIQCKLYCRKNLREHASTVRAAAFSVAKGQRELFLNMQAAQDWIQENGDQEFIYQIRSKSESSLETWAFDSDRSWHTIAFPQNQARGYKSDKDPSIRIH